jgi:hypothetical protein
MAMTQMMRGEGNEAELLAAWKRAVRPLIEEGARSRPRR